MAPPTACRRPPTATQAMAPHGRELDAELGYSSAVLDGDGWLGLNLFGRRQPGHFADADADLGGAVRFTLGF